VRSLLKKRWFRLLILVLVLAIPLAFLLSRAFGGFVRDVVAAPFLYLLWLVRIYVRAVPHTLFWGGLLLLGMGLAVTSILVGAGGQGRRGRGSEEEEARQIYLGQVEQLTTHIQFAARSEYFRSRLSQRLGSILLQALDHGRRYREEEVEQALDALEAPPRVRAFFGDGKRVTQRSRAVGLLARLRARLRGGEVVPAPDVNLEDVVRFLEDRLEVL
jgi:hypothetical protein